MYKLYNYKYISIKTLTSTNTFNNYTYTHIDRGILFGFKKGGNSNMLHIPQMKA